MGPYYSRKGFLKLSCIFFSFGKNVEVPATIIDDPDKSCSLVVFKLPESIQLVFTYEIKKGDEVIFYGKSSDNVAQFKYKLSITTLFKYEVDFLREWIEYHRAVGVEHFYLYENNIIPNPNN